MLEEAYFYLKSNGRNIQTKGLNTCLLGYKLDTGKEKQDGIFAEWSWDGSKLVVHNDRYGFRPLYYCYHNQELYLSPSIKIMFALGAPHDFDYEALSVFLRLGFFVGDDTPFKHIKILPPDADFRYEDEKLMVSGNYAFRKPIKISEDDAIDQYIALFRQSMKRRLSTHPFMMSLSGGRDSRHILFELNHLNCLPEYAVTLRPYPPYYDEDIRIANMLCQALGVKHMTLEHKNSFFTDELRALEATNYCSDEHAWFMVLADYFKGRTSVAYDGIAGDVFSAGDFLRQDVFDLYREGKYSELCKELLNCWNWMRPQEGAYAWMLNENVFKRISLEAAHSRIIHELKQHACGHNPLTSFYFWNRTRRKIALMSYAVNAGVDTVYSPFLDYDLYDFLAALPYDLIKDHTFHTKTIQRAYPQYTHLPYENNDSRKISVFEHQRRYVQEMSRHFLKSFFNYHSLLKSKYLAPRMVVALLNKDYCGSMEWLKPTIITYLMQLEKLKILANKNSKTISLQTIENEIMGGTMEKAWCLWSP